MEETMSSIDKKLDKITGGLSPAEKAQYAASTVIDELEATMAGEATIEAYRDKATTEIERVISTLHPGARGAFSAELSLHLIDFWILRYLDAKHDATVWKLRFLEQGRGLQRACAMASGEAVLPENDVAPRIRRVAAGLVDLRTSGLWEDCGKTPPPLPEDIEPLLADLPDPTA